MTIDQTYSVDTLLAEVSAETLLTRAFHLTHRIDHAESGKGGALRAERDAIVREMTRRSDGFERALVTVEAAERALTNIDAILGAAAVEGDPDALRWLNGRIAHCREVAWATVSQCSSTTASLVKNQDVSDHIADAARAIYRPIVTSARAAAITARRKA